MKKALSCTLGLVVLAVVLMIIGVLTLPSDYQVSRTQVVDGTPSEVYAVASNLHTWPDWTVWSREADPDAVWDWSGAPASVGSSMSWKGEIHKQGRLTLTELDPGKLIGYDLAFIEDGKEMKSTGKMLLTPSGSGTKVVWTMDGELDGIWKLMGPLMNSLIGEMFEVGLVGLDGHLQAN